ncbi:MAG: bifunctional 5,10-methylenetetrahydrofolate dehydrogenase/5,10-methenyltetrahydrofolate cyclohydrolase [bacterium]|nr:bifunctional 5,10-methylenetetrahydrofolate dehydrogenase/5,10-methenyltetrahydrofolate cyclohydrolase [bacterium]
MTVLRGQPVADAILARVRADVSVCVRPPHLVVVLATDREESRTYVAKKMSMVEQVGMRCTVDAVPEQSRTTDALVARVRRWSDDDSVDGIIVQLPLVRAIAMHAVLDAIDPSKDVDGLTSANIAAAYLNEPGFRAATAAAVLSILDFYHIPIVGVRTTIVGRSRLVGLPLAGMLLARDATVTIAHTKTAALADACRNAELLIVASGKPGMVTREMVAAGATVIDVGWARVNGKVVGDVALDVAEVAGALTPVPGGVGPVTVAMLLAQTVRAAQARV